MNNPTYVSWHRGSEWRASSGTSAARRCAEAFDSWNLYPNTDLHPDAPGIHSSQNMDSALQKALQLRQKRLAAQATAAVPAHATKAPAPAAKTLTLSSKQLENEPAVRKAIERQRKLASKKRTKTAASASAEDEDISEPKPAKRARKSDPDSQTGNSRTPTRVSKSAAPVDAAASEAPGETATNQAPTRVSNETQEANISTQWNKARTVPSKRNSDAKGPFGSPVPNFQFATAPTANNTNGASRLPVLPNDYGDDDDDDYDDDKDEDDIDDNEDHNEDDEGDYKTQFVVQLEEDEMHRLREKESHAQEAIDNGSGSPGSNSIATASRMPHIMMVAFACYIAITSPFGQSLFGSVPGEQDTPVCYENHPTITNEEGYVLQAQCNDGFVRQACPQGGVCRLGVLTGCDSSLYTAKNDHCVPSEDTNSTINALKELLETWTVESICGGSSFGQHTTKEGLPFVLFSEVTGHLEKGYSLHYIEIANSLEPTFVLENNQRGELVVALDSYQRLHLPVLCVADRIVMQSITHMGPLLWKLSAFITAVVWSWAQSYWRYPFFSWPFSVLLVLSFNIYMARRQRLERKQAIELGAKTVFEALEHLGESNEEKVKERVLWTLFETNRSKRQKYAKEIWPLVKKEIHLHGGVHKKLIVSSNGLKAEIWKLSG